MRYARTNEQLADILTDVHLRVSTMMMGVSAAPVDSFTEPFGVNRPLPCHSPRRKATLRGLRLEWNTVGAIGRRNLQERQADPRGNKPLRVTSGVVRTSKTKIGVSTLRW